MPADCPSRDQLRTWLDDDCIDLSSHIDTCAACQHSVQTLLEDCDDFLHSFREVAIHAGSADPSQRQAIDAIKEKVLLHLSTGDSAKDGYSDEWLGRNLGQYEIEALLGSGGMGRVYLAQHVPLRKQVAIKLLLASRASQPAAAERFAREWVASAKVNDSHVVQALDAGEIDGVPYLVLEYLEGVNLRRLHSVAGPLSVPAACELIRQAALGLAAMSREGLVHRDIKPSNVMLTSDGTVKLLDLGLARFHDHDPADDGDLTVSGIVLGTMQFMAPEQCQRPREADVRADLYSLGCTFYFLLTGRPPFHGPNYDSIYDVMRGHIAGEVPTVQTYRNDVPEVVQTILRRLLAKSPTDRFASPRELVDALSPFASGAGFDALIAVALRAQAADQASAATPLGRTQTYALRKPVESQGTSTSNSLVQLVRNPRGKRTIAASFVLLFGILFGQTPPGRQVIRVLTNRGELVIQDAAPNVTVVIRQDKVAIEEGQGRRFDLRVGDYELILTEPGGTELQAESFRITRGGHKIVEVRHQPPPDAPSKPSDVVIAARPAVEVHVPEMKPLAPESLGNRFGPTSLVTDPCKITGVRRWTIETVRPRGDLDRVAWNPANTQIAAGGRDGTIRLYDRESLTLTGMLPGLSATESLCWSPDGRFIAAGDATGRITLWNVETGHTVGMWKFSGEHKTVIVSLAWSPDGKILAASVPGEGVVSLDLASPQGNFRVMDTRCNVAIAWSHDGSRLAIGGAANNASLRSNVDGGGATILRDTPQGISAFAWAPDDHFVAAPSAAGNISLWTSDGEVESTFKGETVAWVENPLRLVTAQKNQLSLWNPTTGSSLGVIKERESSHAIRNLESSADGRFVAYARLLAASFGVLDLTNMKFQYSPRGHLGSGINLSWNPNTQQIATSHYWGEMVHFDPRSLPPVRVVPCNAGGAPLGTRSLCWSPDGTRVAFGADTRLAILEPSTEKITVFEDRQVTTSILALDWSTSGIACRSKNGVVAIWDPDTGHVVRTFNPTRSDVGSVAWSPDASTLAIGAGGEVSVWNKDALDDSRRISDLSGETPSVAWSPDSRLLAFPRFGELYVHELESGSTKELRRENADAHDHWPWSIHWLSDGKRLVSHGDSYVRIWDVGTGALQLEIEVSPTTWICAPMDVSSDGRFVGVCGSDRTVRIYRGDDGAPVLNYLTLDDGHWMIIASDGNWIGSEGIESELVYLVETDTGVERLTPDTMRARYGWQPDLERVQTLLKTSFEPIVSKN